MGHTLYLGSLKSDVNFCIYEKDNEQYVKLGTPLEEADIINRFEIRLRNERAYYAVRDLLTYYDAEQTAFSIINQYVRFVDEEPDKRKNARMVVDSKVDTLHHATVYECVHKKVIPASLLCQQVTFKLSATTPL